MNVKATFFLNGRGIEHNLEAAKSLVAAGHEIGNHTYSHHMMLFKGFDEVKREIDRTNSLIRAIGYTGDIYFRPPYGKKLFVLPYYLKQKNMLTVTWDVEPDSYPGSRNSAAAIADTVVSNARPGSIILLHVLGSNNAAARESLPLVIHGLKAKGFQFALLSELVNERHGQS